ncbi:CDP-alcohol phosphatidyltransferase family protein [Neisseria sp. Ec49-e6-T10]|uniref:CDP-alcohol phosphatidyltransferase family protein n=1 Tax=Neisseria sp. Ec49-e6-T10 TaxID=3140744 RepID=UPI003EB7AA73
MPSSTSNRRPIKSRDAKLASKAAIWLNQKGFTPNQISIASVLFALFGAMNLFLWTWIENPLQHVFPLFALIGIQGRLVCNLLDGMVAIEGGKSTRSGELFNDIPDRIADCLLFIAAGYAASTFISWAYLIGYFAAIFAVLTAYVRVLGASMGAPVSFRGPMAKQHRMAVLSFMCLMSCFEPIWWEKGIAFFIGIMIIMLGSLLTTWLRIKDIYDFFEKTA